MNEPSRTVTRRDLLIASGACALAAVVRPLDLTAQEKAPQTWQEVVRAITGSAKVTEGRITLDVPEIAENGNVVPFNIVVDNPMTDTNFVRSLRVFATGNPQALIATFRFSADSGKAAVSSRMRLAKSQDVAALAELNDGTFLTATRTIKVTIGGCGG